MNDLGLYVGIYETTGVMAAPWAEAGYDCICVDIQNKPRTEGRITYVQADVLRWLPPRRRAAFVACFTPCTDQSVSGARWFKEKGLHGLAKSIELAEAGVRICEWYEAPWFVENPVSTMASYWRKPDYTFDPCDYGDPYTKKTCLWTGGGFVMPTKNRVEPTEGSKIHLMPPSPDRANESLSDDMPKNSGSALSADTLKQ